MLQQPNLVQKMNMVVNLKSKATILWKLMILHTMNSKKESKSKTESTQIMMPLKMLKLKDPNPLVSKNSTNLKKKNSARKCARKSTVPNTCK